MISAILILVNAVSCRRRPAAGSPLDHVRCLLLNVVFGDPDGVCDKTDCFSTEVKAAPYILKLLNTDE
jgi:hypothetical protein